MGKTLKDNIIKYYIDMNLSRQDVAKILGLSDNELKYKIKVFNIKKPKGLRYDLISQTNKKKAVQGLIKRKETCLKRYGVENPMFLDSIKNKVKATNLKRYGTESFLASNTARNKIEATNLKKYGCKSPLSNEQVQEKVKETCRDRYGVDYAVLSEKSVKARKETCLKKYGVEYITQDRDIIDKISKTLYTRYGSHCKNTYKLEIEEFLNKDNLEEFLKDKKYTITDLARDLKVSYTTALNYINRYELRDSIVWDDSRLEGIIVRLLDSLDIKYIRRDSTIIKPYELDFYLPDLNMGIEVNDIASHNTIIPYYLDTEPKGRLYHKQKTFMAKEKGVYLIHIAEWELLDQSFLDKLKNLLLILSGKKEVLYARKCIVKNVDSIECTEFLNNNHLQGNCASVIRLGLYYNEELVEVMTFNKPRFNTKYDYELIRLCTKGNYSVIGGASKLLNRFIKIYNPSSIVSYCDISKFTGNVYERLNFTFSHYSEPNYYWYNGINVITRYRAQRKKLERLFGKKFDKELSESDIMVKEGYLKYYDSGQAVYVWKRPKN